MSNIKRNWSKKGKRTSLLHQIGYVNRYLFSAIAPLEGDSFNILGFTNSNTQSTEIFLDNLKEKYPNNHIVIFWDNAPFHKSKILHNKKNLSLMFLPSYGQELNPVERYFGELRKVTANKIFDSITTIENLLDNAIVQKQNDKEAMKKLTYWHWIREQTEEIFKS